MQSEKNIPIVDVHVHFYDHKINRYEFLEVEDATFIELVGDYTSLPRRYLLQNYLEDTKSYPIRGIVWNEFLASDPIKEVRWAAELAENTKIPLTLIALVDFLDEELERKLTLYQEIVPVTGVREHLGWDANNPLRRMAKRKDLLADSRWQQQLNLLRKYDFTVGLEVFSPQLPDLYKIIKQNSSLRFTLPVMGWPLDISPAGFETWRKHLKLISACENVCASISAIEVIFGNAWKLEQIRPWILTMIELFGPERTMFGSHLPITKLSQGFHPLYAAYAAIIADFSRSEQEALLHRTAWNWFGFKNGA